MFPSLCDSVLALHLCNLTVEGKTMMEIILKCTGFMFLSLPRHCISAMMYMIWRNGSDTPREAIVLFLYCVVCSIENMVSCVRHLLDTGYFSI